MPEADPLMTEADRGGQSRWSPAVPGFLLLPGDGLLLVDSSYTITWANGPWLERLAVADQALIGGSLRLIWPDLTLELDQLAEALSQGPIDRRLASPQTGSSDTPEALGLRLFRTDGGFGIGLPLAVAPSEAVDPLISLLCNLLNTVNEAMLVTLGQPLDAPGPIIIFANSRLADYNGYARDEILGRSPRIFQGPESDPQQLRRFRQGLQKVDHAKRMAERLEQVMQEPWLHGGFPFSCR